MNCLFITQPHFQGFFQDVLGPDLKTHFKNMEFFVSQDFKKAKEILCQRPFATVIMQKTRPKDRSSDDPSLLNFLIHIKENYPDTSCLLMAKYLKVHELTDYVNKTNVLGVFHEDWDLEKILALVKKSIDKYVLKNRRIQLVEDISNLNKNLEATTKQLTRAVDKRTKHIKSSQMDAQKKKLDAEKLAHLVQRLGTATGFEEYLITLKEEHKKWHRVIGPLLLVHPLKDKSTFYFLQGKVMKVRSWPQNIQQIYEKKQSLFRKTLADLLGRPLGPLLEVPFGQNGHLMFEHNLTKQELADFKKHIHLNKQGLAISFQRIFQDNELTFAAKLWQKTFDVISDPIAIVNSSGHILRSNVSFQLLNTKENSILKKLESMPIFKTHLAKKTSQKSDPYQIQISRRLFEVNCFNMDSKLSLKASQTYKVYFLRDITTSKRLYSQMIQQEKMIALGHLAGNITHELNNPLTGLRALAQVIANELDKSSDFYKDILEIENALKRSQDIIKNLLEFTSPEKDSNIQCVELDDLVKKTLPFLKTAIRFHTLKLDLNSKGFYVKVSSSLIQQVIFNLINNACEAMDDGGQISITTSFKSSQKQDFAELKVSDNGPGIPKDLEQQIFLPFITIKKKEKGTGLGLHLCQSIVRKYQGEIFHNTAFRDGTQFIVRLPIVKSKQIHQGKKNIKDE